MTQGYLCNGISCGTFLTGQPAATYQHRATLVLDDGTQKTELLEAHFCDDCAIELTQRYELLGDHVDYHRGEESE